MMTVTDSISEERLRQSFKHFNRLMLFFWRIGFGFWFRWPKAFGCIMVLIHRGRKTGLIRRTPLNFTIHDGDIYCMAGFGPKSDWLWNILDNPEVEVWLPDGWWEGEAEVVEDSEPKSEILRQLLIASGFAAPAFGLNPEQITDAELDRLLESYRLVRIRRTAACTGAGGPADLAWIWQVFTFLLIPIVLLQLMRKRTKRK